MASACDRVHHGSITPWVIGQMAPCSSRPRQWCKDHQHHASGSKGFACAAWAGHIIGSGSGYGTKLGDNPGDLEGVRSSVGQGTRVSVSFAGTEVAPMERRLLN